MPLNAQDTSFPGRTIALERPLVSSSLATAFALALDADQHLISINLMALLVAFRRRGLGKQVDR